MGQCMGKTKYDRTVSLRPSEPLEQPISEVFSDSLASPGNGMTSPKQRFARRTSAHKGVMSSIAIKFPHIKRSFLACKDVFEKHADPETNSLSKEKVAGILLELGARPESLNEERMTIIIETANLDKDDSIDFKEFLIAAAVGCFLRANPERENPMFLRIRKGFEVAKEAFGKIDKDGSGQIDFVELKEAFVSMKEDDLILERLKELDFNGDKEIEFPEFVWGLCAWVGMDEDLEDEDDTDIDDYKLDSETSLVALPTKEEKQAIESTPIIEEEQEEQEEPEEPQS